MNTPNKLTPEQIAAHDDTYEPTREQAVEYAKDYLRRFDELPHAQQDDMSPFGFRSHLVYILRCEAEIESLREEVEALRKQVVDKNLEIERLTGDFKALVKEYEQLAAANNGKTLRDEIAIAAMPAISIHSSPDTIKKTARRAYDLADAMLEARKGGYEVIE